MLNILEKVRGWWNPQPAVAPIPRRVKNYGSQAGFQYRYRLEKSVVGEYWFLIWAAGQQPHELRICVPLTDLEPKYRYALAKLRLFRILDDCVPGQLPSRDEVLDASALESL